jgi:DNA-binding NarL/FixJ family response regulator
MEQTRVLIVDDHVLVRRGIRTFLDIAPLIQVVGEAADAEDAIGKAETLQPDVILMDLALPGKDGVQSISEIKDAQPDVKIIVLTHFSDEQRVKAAMQAGADGFLLKDADGDALLEAIHAVQEGGMPIHPQVAPHLFSSVMKCKDADERSVLTVREKEVLQLVAQGMSNRAAARALGISEGTVKVHVSNIIGKLKVSSRTEAALKAAQLGLVLLEKGV